jgi:hypothetical protein
MTTGTEGAPYYSADDIDEDRGVGWLFFAATVLGLGGFMRILDSIWAFRYKGALPDGLKDGTLGSNLKTYGWVWLAVGVLYIVSSFLILARSQFGRWVGIVAAFVGGLAAITWMPYYPIWAITYIVIAVLVFYGLLVHGGRISS